MNSNNTATATPPALNLSMFTPSNRDLTVKVGEASKAGVVSMSARRMSRKEYADANKLDKNATTFDDAYKAYLKGQESHGAMLVAGAHTSGLIFAATSARKDKDGNIIGLSVRFTKPPTEKKSAAASKLAEMEAKNLDLMNRLAALEKLLPAPAAKAVTPELPIAPAPAPKK